MTRNADQITIRRVVDRVIDTLGPDTSSDEIHKTAAAVLERLGRPSDAGTVVLVDVPCALSPDLTRLSGMSGPVWVRSAVDLPPRDPGPAAQAAVAHLGSLPGREGRICLTVGPAAPGMPLDWVGGLLERDARLRIAVVCARPGLGVDRTLLRRLVEVRESLDTALAGRLFAACMRLPLRRTGLPRIEVLIPHGADGHENHPHIGQAAPLLADLRATLSGQGVDVAAMLLVPAGATSEQWLQLRSWRIRHGTGSEPIRGLRVSGWPADGVRPFGDTPLRAAADQVMPLLSSLACGCAQAPVCLSPPQRSGNGTAP